HIDGRMNAMQRDSLMQWLKKDEGQCKALSNVRCLSEGVDVPALDAVIFMDSKASLVDVVQSVGRVMRKAEGKNYGYVIIPIVVPKDKDANEALDDNDVYKVVWQVLRALRSHDERLEAEINTFMFKKDKTKGRIHIGYPGTDTEGHPIEIPDGQYSMDDFGSALMARLVLKVGEREYIENWAKNVAEVMPDLLKKLELICQYSEHGYKQYQPAFNRYLKGLRSCVNDNVSEEDAINMLAQQIITKPIFERLFGGEGFAMKNSVSQTIDKMLKEIYAKDGLKDINEKLKDFYKSVETTLNDVETTEGKQTVIKALYGKFFKNAFSKDQAINGVVYTPQEIVDFIIRSAAEVLRKEFNLDISGENINILDPFTGTGTFIAGLMESGLISKEDLERKYKNELFANEITLLAYYIATVNIENTFVRITESDKYIPFENILLTDTFNIDEICKQKTIQSNLYNEDYFVKNKATIKKEHDTQITVIMGNPPYGANQKSANDNAKKRTYKKGIDAEIESKYLDDKLFNGKKGNVNSVYDNYIRAFRWSTDCIGNNDGVIIFITPNGWLTGSAFLGFRKCIEKEFSKIYIFNLRGDQNGQNWKEEGEKVFGQGSKIGISITMLIKCKDFRGKAKVFYVKTNDYMKRQEKFDLLNINRSFSHMENEGILKTLNIKENGDWIIERNEAFQNLIPIAGDTHKKFDKHDEKTIFVGYSRGYGTSRDIWSYNFSKEKVSLNIESMINIYNNLIDVGGDPYKVTVQWDQNLLKTLKNKEKIQYDFKNITNATYRPFCKMWFYFDKRLIHETANMSKLFPTPDIKNLLICVAGVGVKKDFSCLITNRMTDLEIVGKSQCFPLYWYENKDEIRTKNKQKSLFDNSETLIRHDGISGYALALAHKKYGSLITKEDIFFYIYGYLHSPEYRSTLSEDL
ncbi:MAG: type ISP restriction/modification enzyme, partial [Prevotella sp.]